MSNPALAIALAEVSSILTVLVISSHAPWSGRVLIRFTDTHGLHSGDLPVLGLWVLAMVCCGALWRRG